MDDLKCNDNVYLLGFEQDCGKGVVDGTNDGVNVLVRFTISSITSKGLKELKNYRILNPNGKAQRIYSIPSHKLVSVASSKVEIKDERRNTRKAGKRTSQSSKSR
jgi:hypothetical protein